MVIGGVALFLFQYFEEKVAKQLTFALYILTLFVETWFTDNAKKIKAGRGSGGSPASPVSVPGQTWPSSLPSDRSTFGDFLSVLAIFIPSAIMADSFFFTDWLDLPATSPGPGELDLGAIAVVVKIVASVLALGIAFLGPVVVSVFSYIGLTSWMEERTADRRRAAGEPATQAVGAGCLALVPAAVVLLLGYGHFLLSYAFYEAIGALRTQ
ncbi:hypothetical protein O7614_14035 [Micromonospora sp. WMMD961]|uniref:hypothetical protein n=1 Tax=Micromonospora sp. WMMD961 TaxID=3016100 RepID=UPI0024162DEF|nr:hypothetical protein [Micromonospora sp. WMMD961]MDG4780761.1 hypothetical protein [Micromonospora sp. WMMD961]